MSFYQDKHVAVIGGAGMIGTALCKKLHSVGANVHVVDNFSRGHRRLHEIVTYHAVPATEEPILRHIFNYNSIDYVFNLAAHVAGVEYNQMHQSEMFHKNVALQLVPLRAAEISGVERFLQTSSVCVYGENKQWNAVEWDIGDAPADANYGYSMAKRAGEIAIDVSTIPFSVIVRPTNVYGLYDYYDERAHVIPALMKKFKDDDVVVVNGDKGIVREFVFADDVASAMVGVMQFGENGGVYNIGTNGRTAVTLEELVGLIAMVSGIDKKIEWKNIFDSGDNKRSTNSFKLEELGYGCYTELIDGLSKVWDELNGG